MLREETRLTKLSATSFEDLLSRDGNICFRQQTALGEVMRNLDVDPAQLINIGNATGGFAAHAAYGAELLRAGRCSAMVLPEWFAENTLIMGANAPCDLRLIRRPIRVVAGGYVTASPYSRLKALTATVPEATMADLGCMDVRHNHQSKALAQKPSQLHDDPPRPPHPPWLGLGLGLAHPRLHMPCAAAHPRLHMPCATACGGDAGRAAARLPLRGAAGRAVQAEGAHHQP